MEPLLPDLPVFLSRAHTVRWCAWCGLLFCLAVGCRRESAELDPRGGQWARGDRVVVEASAGEFYEARVVGVEGDQLRIQRVTGGSSAVVSSQEVYRLPPRREVVRVGQLLVCSLDEGRWVPCRVEGVVAQGVDVESIDGRDQELPPTRILIPTELTRLNLERRFADLERQTRFEAAAKRAGEPAVPKEWRPRPRERLIARRPEGWFSCAVHEIEDDRVHVRWTADRRVTEITQENVAPEGPYPSELQPESFVLTRPESPADPWERWRVKGLVEDHSVLVENARGERRVRRLRDAVPLAPR